MGRVLLIISLELQQGKVVYVEERSPDKLFSKNEVNDNFCEFCFVLGHTIIEKYGGACGLKTTCFYLEGLAPAIFKTKCVETYISRFMSVHHLNER